MFLKHEKPEMDDFERKNFFCPNGKYFENEKFLTDTLSKKLQNIYAYFWFQNILSIFLYFEKKNLHFQAAAGGGESPRLVDASALN